MEAARASLDHERERDPVSDVSRRAFLQMMGITGAAALAPWPTLNAAFAHASSTGQPAVWGRALCAVPVMDRADQLVRTVLPDEVVPLRSVSGSQAQLADGSADFACFQPVAAPPSSWTAPAAPGWAQVAAPYAVLRAWCASDAPIVARPGWGAVFAIDDLLTVGDVTWARLLAGDHMPQAWSPVNAWQPVTFGEPAGSPVSLIVDRRAQTIAVQPAGGRAWTAEALVSETLSTGTYPLLSRRPAENLPQPGAPWALDFGAWRAYGAYWHNSFGNARAEVPSGAIELPVLVAQALFGLPVTAAYVI